MKDNKRVCFIIQARVNSTRLNKKMIRPFADSSLIEKAIGKVLQSDFPRENLFLSICDKELIDIATKYKINIYHRTPESVQEGAGIKDIFGWYCDLDYDYYILMSPCCPLLRVETINEFINNFMSSESNGLFSVFEKKHFLYDVNHKMLNNYLGDKEKFLFDTKQLEPVYEAAAALYGGSMEDIERDVLYGTFQTKTDPEFFIMKEEECFDIDYLWQFEVAEVMYKRIFLEENK